MCECLPGGQAECQRQRLPTEGRLLQAGTEGLARLLRGGATAAGQTPGQVSAEPGDTQIGIPLFLFFVFDGYLQLTCTNGIPSS